MNMAKCIALSKYVSEKRAATEAAMIETVNTLISQRIILSGSERTIGAPTNTGGPGFAFRVPGGVVDRVRSFDFRAADRVCTPVAGNSAACPGPFEVGAFGMKPKRRGRYPKRRRNSAAPRGKAGGSDAFAFLELLRVEGPSSN